MEARKEAIRIAYGNDWEKVKDYIDENGWIKDGQYHNGQPIDFEIMEIDWECVNDEFQSIIRPITLKGIENNNGWIIIENEKYLPELDLEYKVGKMINDKFYISNSVYDKEELSTSFSEGKITHYLPIQKPKPPIY